MFLDRFPCREQSLPLLGGGDRRSIGPADQVAAMVSHDPALFPQLIAGLRSEDPLVRMRAADAAEKVTRKHDEYLLLHKKELLSLMMVAKDQELRWHLAMMVPRIPLDAKEMRAAMSALNAYLDDRSSMVKTFALQGMADMAKAEPDLRPGVVEILRAAMKARSRRLLIQLGRI